MKQNKKSRQRAGEIHRLYEYLSGRERSEWLARSKEGHDYYLGNQLSDAERKTMAERMMPDYIINKMQPQIELGLYFCTASRPAWRAIGVDGSDSTVAAIGSDVLQHIGKFSRYQQVVNTVLRDAFTKGWGFFLVDVDPKMDEGRGEILYTSLDPWDVYPDPSSRDPLLTDASYIMVAKMYSLEQILSMMPQYAKQAREAAQTKEAMHFSNLSGVTTFDLPGRVDSTSAGPVDYDSLTSGYNAMSREQQYVKYFELYEKIIVPMVNVIVKMPTVDEQGEQVMQLQQMTMSQDEFTQMVKLDPEFASMVHDVSEWDKVRVVRTKSFGQTHVLEDRTPLPGSEYPIVGISWLHTGTVYPISMAWNMVGKQQEINKAHQLMIHHAMLTANFKYFVEEKMVVDEEQWDTNSAKPGGRLKFRRGPNGEMPQAVMPAPLNSAFYQIVEKAERDMEYLSGMSAGMMGQEDYSGREPYRGLLARDQFGSRRISAWVRNVMEPAFELLGRVLIDWAREFYTPDKLIMVAQPGDIDKWEKVGITGIQYDPRDIEAFFDTSRSYYDLIFVSGSTLEVNRWARQEEYAQYFQLGIIDDYTMLSVTDVPDKPKVYERVGMISKLNGQVAQLSEEIQEAAKQVDRLERLLIEERANAKVGAIVNTMLRQSDKFKMELDELMARAERESEANAGTSAEREGKEKTGQGAALQKAQELVQSLGGGQGNGAQPQQQG
jgi:hypothetical protein